MNFTCEKCDFSFPKNWQLTRHTKVVHDKIKNIKCDKCAYICSNNSHLKQHVKSFHNKIKDFKCDKCVFVCSSNNELKIHTKAVHDKIKDFKCDECEYICFTNSQLSSHIKRIHDKIRDYKCDLCDYLCSSNGDLKKHIKQVHDKIKDVKCDKCDFVFCSKGELKRHIKSVHERPIMDKHMSLGEYAISNYLTKKNIVFQKEKSFNNLLSPKNKLLRFDFYIEARNLLIEFDGRQHFEKVKWTSIDTNDQIDERYNYLVECDHLKNEYADTNNIKLYRIKYTDIKNIDNILKVLLH